MADLERPWATRADEAPPSHGRNGAEDYVPLAALLNEVRQSDREFKFQTWEQLEAADANSGGVQWVVEGLVERGTMPVFYGPPGAAKTYVALDLALSVALGEPFAGRATSPGIVVYVGGEGPRAFGRRIRAWRYGRGITQISPALLYLPERVGLAFAGNCNALSDAIKAAEDRLGLATSSIIFDTWQRHLEGDENSTTDVARACRNVATIRDTHDASAIVLHHTGWGDGARIRGARVLEGECDSMFQVVLDETRNVTTLTCERMRDGDKPGPITFQGHRVELDGPGGAVSWYVQHDASVKPTSTSEASLGPKELSVLRCIRQLHRGEEERMVAAGANPVSAEVTLRMVREELVTRGIYPGDDKSKRAIYNALKRLHEKKLIAKRGRNGNMVPV